MPSCCICLSRLTKTPAHLDGSSEKPSKDRNLNCCGRIVCASCLSNKPQYHTYCPYCQITRLPRKSKVPSSRSKEAGSSSNTEQPAPPPYSKYDPKAQPALAPAPAQSMEDDSLSSCLRSMEATDMNPPLLAPPVYEDSRASTTIPQGDVLHYVRPNETFTTLSLAYKLPLQLLKSHNHIATDFLLHSRQTINIPCPPYQGESMSPEPVEGFAEHERKTKVSRFMRVCKCADQKMAETYMEDASGDLDAAILKWHDDELWMERNPTGNQVAFGTWLLQARRRAPRG